MRLTAYDLAEISGGTLFGDPALSFNSVITDSRISGAGAESLFIALRGPNHDGHRFTGTLYSRGVRLFLTEYIPEDSNLLGAVFVTVNDTLVALQKLAEWNRRRFTGPVIAVTGSAGKTIVKEWLAVALGNRFSVIRSPRSYNSQVGVALSLLYLDNSYHAAVIEAGISRPGEMEKLARMIKPDVVIVTNIGDAHGENFRGREEIAAEKLKLAVGADRIIYCADDNLPAEVILAGYGTKDLFSWSAKGKEANLRITSGPAENGGQILECNSGDISFTTFLPFSDRASLENASSVIACCLALEMPATDISAVIPHLPAVAMRMEIKMGINGCTLIEDYYNSDPGSLNMALDFLRGRSRGKTTVILSDFRQIGGDERGLYENVARALDIARIDRFIGIGKSLLNCRDCFHEGSVFYESTQSFVDTFKSFSFSDETILLKGARDFGFERISSLLVRQLHQTRLEINMNAVVHNLNEFRRLLNPGTRIMAMVKAFAYGSGSAEIASLLEYHQIGYFAVAYADEGVALREAGITTPVMVMNPDDSAVETIIRNNLEPEIYCMESLEGFRQAAGRHGLLHYPVHIKVDTGMHRLGFAMDEISQLGEILSQDQRLKVVSLFSHLAASENSKHDSFTRLQADRLKQASVTLSRSLGYSFMLHLLNSSGISRFPEFQFDMVRIGIGLYGIGEYNGLKLRPTGRFVTSVSQVRIVPAGDPVSYGCKGSSDHQREVAVIPVGYADGLRREMGDGKGSLFIRGHKAPFIGSICMDMCMADVTDMGVKRGDEAEIFGSEISLDEVAQLCNTIPYEILTSLPTRVKRIYLNE